MKLVESVTVIAVVFETFSNKVIKYNFIGHHGLLMIAEL